MDAELRWTGAAGFVLACLALVYLLPAIESRIRRK